MTHGYIDGLLATQKQDVLYNAQKRTSDRFWVRFGYLYVWSTVRLLGGTPAIINGVCTVTQSRLNLHPTILGRRSRSFLTIPQAYSFESMDSSGRALCLGETVILQSEIQKFISVLRKHGIQVTALHNHWLFEQPRLMYVHFQAINKPLVFAQHVRAALNTLTK